MNCSDAAEWMHRLVDGDLDGLEEVRLLQHLDECAECRDLFERLKRLDAELSQLPKVRPPFSLVDAILPELDRMDAETAATARTGGDAVAPEVGVPVGHRPTVDVSRGAPGVPAAERVERSKRKHESWTPRRWFDVLSFGLAGAVAASVVFGVFAALEPGGGLQQAGNSLTRQAAETADNADMRSNAEGAKDASGGENQNSARTAESPLSADSQDSNVKSPQPTVPRDVKNQAGAPSPSPTDMRANEGESASDDGGSPARPTARPNPTANAGTGNPTSEPAPPPSFPPGVGQGSSPPDSDPPLGIMFTPDPGSSATPTPGSQTEAPIRSPSATPDPNVSTMGFGGTNNTADPVDRGKLPAAGTGVRSPDGRRTARVEDSRIVIRRTDNNELQFRSNLTWDSGAAIELGEWTSATTFTYSVTVGDQRFRYVVDMSTRTERSSN